MGDTGNCGTELNFYFILFHAARRTKFLFTPLFLPLLLFWRRGFPETRVYESVNVCICTFEKCKLFDHGSIINIV